MKQRRDSINLPVSPFRFPYLCFLCVSSVALLALAGCGQADSSGDHPHVVKVTGTVRYQGKAVEGAEVTFNNTTANSTGTAKTDSSGRFALSTFGKEDGVIPGKQLVSIRRVDVIDKTPPDVDVTAGGKSVPLEYHWIIPQKYSAFGTSGLTADVTEGGPNDFPFDLK